MHGKVRRLWWLNPEPKEHWGSADSIAGEFAFATDGMFETRNLRQLEAFVKKSM